MVIFRELITAITDSENLYESADPYQPVNVICYADGDRSSWHFDSSNSFTMTLMLQAADSGGEFEMVPNIRTNDDPGEERLSKTIAGRSNRCEEFSPAGRRIGIIYR